MPVPRLLDIFSPLTVMKPCTFTASGVLRPANFSIAGQNSAWKYTMSLPMKWTCSVLPAGSSRASKSRPLSAQYDFSEAR